LKHLHLIETSASEGCLNEGTAGPVSTRVRSRSFLRNEAAKTNTCCKQVFGRFGPGIARKVGGPTTQDSIIGTGLTNGALGAANSGSGVCISPPGTPQGR
jgi:hypothetical protein